MFNRKGERVMKKLNNKGFSLVELIIVIAIMAVLIGVLAPQFIKYVEKSKQSKDITNLDSCVEAVKVYYADRSMASTVKIDGNPYKSSDSNKALSDAGATACSVTGKWTTAPEATVTSDGVVTYKGESSYYTVQNNEFTAKS